MSPPDLVVLEAFFECEAMLADPAVGWRNNTLTFETERNGYRIWCELRPVFATLSVVLSAGDLEVARADLGTFTSLEIMSEGARELMVARFGDTDTASLWLTLRPQVSLRLAA